MHHNSVILTKMKQIELFFQAIFSAWVLGRQVLRAGILAWEFGQTFLQTGIFAWVLGQTFLRAGTVAWVLGQVFPKMRNSKHIRSNKYFLWKLDWVLGDHSQACESLPDCSAAIHKVVNLCLTARQPFTKLWMFAWVFGSHSQGCERSPECSGRFSQNWESFPDC